MSLKLPNAFYEQNINTTKDLFFKDAYRFLLIWRLFAKIVPLSAKQ